MSTWRRKALELLPEIRIEIESSKSPSILWCEIFYIFIISVDNNDQDLIRRILLYLFWCTSDAAGNVSNETQQAVYCGFLEKYNSK